MPFRCVRVSVVVVCMAMAATVGGCSNRAQLFENNGDGGWFSKPVDLFIKPESAQATSPITADWGPTGPVAAEDLVSVDGTCAAKVVEASATTASPPAAASVANPPAGSPAGNDAASTSSGDAPGGTAITPVVGGIALGMSECETVRHAGTPSHVTISEGEKGERQVVLTYSEGSRPGIYTFNGGRLRVVDAVQEPEKPVRKTAKTKKAPQRSKSAAQQGSTRVVVQ